MALKKLAVGEELDFGFNWTDWLETNNESIATSSWDVPSGLTRGDEINDGSTTGVFLSGGTEGVLYEVPNTIVTDAAIPRTAVRTLRILIVSKKVK